MQLRSGLGDEAIADGELFFGDDWLFQGFGELLLGDFDFDVRGGDCSTG